MYFESRQPRTVAKFGGTSVLRPYAVHAALQTDRPIVTILSAAGRDSKDSAKLTDLLIEYEQEPSVALFRRMIGKVALVTGADERPYMSDIAKQMMGGIAEYRSHDWPLAALGERWTAERYESRLGMAMYPPNGLVQVDTDGRLLVAESLQAIREHIDPAWMVLVPGYYGADRDGNVRTLERGGSDITGALFALALRAAEYHNWSDVDGIYDLDPRHHAEAELVSSMAYRDVIVADNQVFHPAAAELLDGTQVATVIRNTIRMDGHRGTIITSHGIGEAA